MRAIPEAGVRSITPLLLHLRRGARECYLGMLEGEHPELMPGTGSSTAAGAYTRKRYQVEIAATVADSPVVTAPGEASRTGEDERRPLSNPILDNPR